MCILVPFANAWQALQILASSEDRIDLQTQPLSRGYYVLRT
jgi:hypothetical protein